MNSFSFGKCLDLNQSLELGLASQATTSVKSKALQATGLLVLKEKMTKIKPICGGALITRLHFLTSASCTDIFNRSTENVFVRFIGNSLKVESEVSAIFIHPEWNPNNSIAIGNFAVLLVDLSKNIGINPFCIDTSSSCSILGKKEKYFISAWGTNDLNTGSNLKLYIPKTSPMTAYQCLLSNTTTNLTFYNFTETSICSTFTDDYPASSMKPKCLYPGEFKLNYNLE